MEILFGHCSDMTISFVNTWNMATVNPPIISGYGANVTIKYEGRESQEYFDIINIYYHSTFNKATFW